MAFPKGIDVSKWQASTPPLTGLAFLIARASIGTAKDERYDQHIGKARAAGLVTGAYHFNWDTAVVTPEQQARAFVAAAGDVDFYFLDVEGEHSFTADETRRFIAEVHRLGKRCGLYMSASAYRWSVGQDYDWVAKWSSTPPTGDWEFWQYTSSGSIAGYSGRLDMDYFNGTLDELRALARGDDMANITTYLPGHSADLGLSARVRTAPSTASGSILRTTNNEQWPAVIGWVKGENTSGSDQWLMRWAGGRYEYTHKVNVDRTWDPTPFSEAQVEAAQDAAVTAATAPLAAQIDQLESQVSSQAGTITQLQGDLETANAQAASAASAEKERIAVAHGAKHADEIRAL